MYYWRIKWKDYNEQELIITDNQGKYLNNQLILDPTTRGDRFTLNGVAYRYDSIDNVEPTTKRVESDIKQLLAGAGLNLESGPMLDLEGYVIANWYKRLISSKDYERYYARHPAYYTLDRGDSGNITIAFRRVEMMNSEHPTDIELCNEQESNRLWKYYID